MLSYFWPNKGLATLNVDFKLRFAVANNDLGRIFIEQGKYYSLDKTSLYFTEFNNLMKQLYSYDSTNISYKNGLAISYENLGRLQANSKNYNNAINYYEKETKLFEELYKSYPENVVYKHGLAVAYSKLGEVYGMLENLNKSIFFYTEFNRLVKELYNSFPSNTDFTNSLAISYQFLGIMNELKGNSNSTLSNFNEYSKLKRELYTSFPSNVYHKNGLALSYFQIGNFYLNKKKDKINARVYFEKCKELWAEMVIAFPDSTAYKNNLLWATQNLAKTVLDH